MLANHPSPTSRKADVQSEPLGMGLVGLGRWGSKVARASTRVDDLRVAAVCDAELARAQRAALELWPVREGTPPACSQLEALLGNPAVQAVVIATPPTTHAELALRCLAAGRHVMVEKPMALTNRDAERMATTARRAGLTLMVGHVLNYHPTVRELERRLHDGVAGELLGIAGERFAPRHTTECSWWNLAPHDISLCQRFFRQTAQRVTCHRTTAADGTTECVARLRFEGRRWALLHLSHRLERPRRSRLTCFGTRGTLVMEEDPKGSILRAGPPLAPGARRWCNEAFPNALPERPPSGELLSRMDPKSERDTPLVRELHHFVAAVRSGHAPMTDGREGAEVVRTLVRGAGIGRGSSEERP